MAAKSPVAIRRLTEGDAEQLWNLRGRALELEPSAFSESPAEHCQTTVDKYTSQLEGGNPDNFVLGGWDRSDLIAMAGFYTARNLKERHKGFIWGVFVEPSHRGKGIGRALISGILARARLLPHVTQIQLSVASTQKAARRLYIALGFQPFGVEPQALNIDGVYVDEEHMVLQL